jgi:hypothetical protein
MIGDLRCHGWSAEIAMMLCFTQFLMWEAKVVSRPNKPHPSSKLFGAMNRMPTTARQTRQTLPKRPIKPFDKGGIQIVSSS